MRAAACCRLSRFVTITPPSTSTMKFSQAALSLVFLSRPTAAWSSAGHLPRPALTPLRAVSTDTFATEVIGEEATESFRLQFKEGSSSISPWHDIPLSNDDGSFNMVRLALYWSRTHSEATIGNAVRNALSHWTVVCIQVVEIPKMSKAKMEVATKEPNNPIAQDMKKGKLRDYHGTFRILNICASIAVVCISSPLLT